MTAPEPAAPDPAPGRPAGHRLPQISLLGFIGLFIVLLTVPGAIAHQFQVDSRFSAELVVSELQLTLAEDGAIMPATLLGDIALEDLEEIEVPWGRLADGSLIEECTAEGWARFDSLERPLSLTLGALEDGTRLLIASEGRDDRVRIAFRPAPTAAPERRGRLGVSLGGRVETHLPGHDVEAIDYGLARTAVATPAPDLWSMELGLRSPGARLLYPSIAAESVGTRVTDALDEARRRGRLEESAILSGTFHVHGIDGGEHTVHSGDELDLRAARRLLVDRIAPTGEGLRVSLRGSSDSILISRQGEREQVVPSYLERAYRTEGGRLAITVAFGVLIVLIEFLLDLVSEARAGSKDAD